MRSHTEPYAVAPDLKLVNDALHQILNVLCEIVSYSSEACLDSEV